MRSYDPILLLAYCLGLAYAAAVPVTALPDFQPTGVVRRATSTSTALVAVTPFNGGYVGPVTVNGVVYTSVLYDTGSNGLWVNSNEPATGKPFNIKYGSGYVNGTLSSGTVTVGGITVENQVYGHKVSCEPYYSRFDGVLGLGPLQTYYEPPSNTWLNNVNSQFKQPWIGANLNDKNYYNANGHTFSFGYDEKIHESGDLRWAAANLTRNSWHVPVSSFSLATGDAPATCLVDSGDTGVWVPAGVAAGYWSQVPGAVRDSDGQWNFPCDSKARPKNMPAFKPVIGGVTYTIPGESTYYYELSGTCYARIRVSNSCVLGQPFFFGTYVVFDYGKKALGFATHVR